MKYLKISKWDKWQSYRADRGQPPWIKIHRRLLRSIGWSMLSDRQKGHLVSIWMLAADRGGEIPNDPLIVKKFCGLDDEPNLQVFIDLGFIDDDGTVATTCRQDDANVTAQKQSQKRVDADAEAEKIMVGEVLAYLNRMTKRSFSSVTEILKCFRREKCSVDDCVKVIDLKAGQWLGTDMAKHLNPVTPFRPSKFAGYLDEANAGPAVESGKTKPEMKQFGKHGVADRNRDALASVTKELGYVEDNLRSPDRSGSSVQRTDGPRPDQRLLGGSGRSERK
jgi:uncharacterized phage protein (TIGR02220 family)